MWESLIVGLRYVWSAPIVRRILLRSALFAVPASALWALLPLVVAHSFHLGSTGYGLVLGVLGIGALIGVALMPWVRTHMSSSLVLASSALLFALGTLAAAVLSLWPSLMLFLLAGVAWIATLTTLNAGTQLTLPQWVRARGMSVYLLVFMGSQGIGSFLWGAVGSAIGTRWALIVAAICLVIAAASVVVLPLSPVTGTLSRELIHRGHHQQPLAIEEVGEDSREQGQHECRREAGRLRQRDHRWPGVIVHQEPLGADGLHPESDIRHELRDEQIAKDVVLQRFPGGCHAHSSVRRASPARDVVVPRPPSSTIRSRPRLRFGERSRKRRPPSQSDRPAS
ncbi:H+ Antiporter protein [Gordonia bronchialis]|nr:H+ Antiporter protein [Gordonia bronchialis]